MKMVWNGTNAFGRDKRFRPKQVSKSEMLEVNSRTKVKEPSEKAIYEAGF